MEAPDQDPSQNYYHENDVLKDEKEESSTSAQTTSWDLEIISFLNLTFYVNVLNPLGITYLKNFNLKIIKLF